jgi:hypothetical protein
MTGQLIAPVDGVEIKFTFSGDHLKSAAKWLGLETSAAEEQVVYFFDTLITDEEQDRLRLLDAGVILRLREVAEGPDNSTLKLRPALAERLTGAWRAGSKHQDDYRVEYDWSAQPVLAASVESKVKPGKIPQIVSGRQPLRNAFSEEQETFLRKCGPALDDPFDHLEAAGPIAALRWRDLNVDGFTGKLRAEQWTYGEGPSFLEISARSRDVDRAADLRTELLGLVEQQGLTMAAGAAKTETVLRSLLKRRGEVA